MRSRLALALALLAAGSSWAAPPQGSLTRGEQLAREICSACHVVAKNQEYPPLLVEPAPAFADIARRPNTTLKSLRHFIRSTHWDMQRIPMSMPNPMLTDDETSAVAQYILSLKTP